MLKCKFCGNEYRQAVSQCPTCGGREFEDNLMTVQYGVMGYGMMMSQPCVVHLSSAQSVYPMSGVAGSYVFKEG